MYHTFAWTYSGNRDWYGDFGYMRKRPLRMVELQVSLSGPISAFSSNKRMCGSWSIKNWSVSPVFNCNKVGGR